MHSGSSFEKTISRTTTHQYLVKKYGNKKREQFFNFEEIIQQIQDVFCIMCESYIPTNEINRHAVHCNGQSDQIEQIDSLQQKLQKCNLLIVKIKKMLKDYSSDQQSIIQYLQMLHQCVSDITVSVEVHAMLQIQPDLELFTQYFENQQQDPYIEQLISQILTILSKISQFTERKLKILQDNQLNVINHLKDSIATSLANESCLNKKVIHESQLSRYRNPFENVQNNIHQSLRNTFSSRQANHLKSKLPLSPINETSQIVGLSPRLEQSLQITQFTQQKSQVEKKNHFFKVAQQLKKQFPHKIAVQQSLIIGLYDQANKLNIPMDDYEDYIENLFINM